MMLDTPGGDRTCDLRLEENGAMGVEAKLREALGLGESKMKGQTRAAT